MGQDQEQEEDEYTRRIHMMKQKATKKKDKQRKKKTKAAAAAAAAKTKAQELTAQEAVEEEESTNKPTEEEEAAETTVVVVEEDQPTSSKTEGGRYEPHGLKMLAAWESGQSYEEASAVVFRDYWNTSLAWAPYEEITNIHPMRFTYSGSNHVYPRECLQIVSVKLESIRGGLRWPLQVFGHVFIRDVLDHKRNMIFHRQRDDCQTITTQEPYLALTGPTRAVIVSVDPSYIEVDLKVKGATESQDKDLSSLVTSYRSYTGLEVNCYTSRLSTLELRFCHIPSSVEATIMATVTCGSWPDGLGGSFTAAAAGCCNNDCKVKLLDFGSDGGNNAILPVGVGGLIKLSHSVVSVGLNKGELKVCVMACSVVNGERVAVSSDEATFTPRRAGVSPGVKLRVGSCRLKVSVGWSLFAVI